MFKFIHAADLHVDSPLRGLEAYEGAPLDELRGATRQAFSNLVSLAIDQQVNFVIIAGDLFDGQWPDMRTGLWTANQFRRLANEKIDVYLIRGNHDAESKVRQSITWPDNVRQFSVEAPETFIDERLAVALHGQGFAEQQCPVDLAAAYPSRSSGMFNIGVLHTSFSGNPDHCTYAPTSEDVLVGHGYDYWALGHVHRRSDPPIRQHPFIAFSGNTQGRHIRETGAKGCLLVSVDQNEIKDIQFHATDVLRWHLAEVELGESDRLPELFVAVRKQLSQCKDESESRLAAIRVDVRGACAAHHSLSQQTQREEVLAEIQNLANEMNNVWVERIVLDTSAPVDLKQLREGSDLLGELLRGIQQMSADEAMLSELADHLSPLRGKAAVELKAAGIDLEDVNQIQAWLKQAEGLLVTQLRESAT